MKSVYALIGSDVFLQLQKQGEILRELPPDAQRVDLNGEKVELSDVLDEVRSFAMFGGHKVVIVRDADEFVSRFREPMERYFAAPVESATLVLRCEKMPKTTRVYKLIDKLGGVMDCTPPTAAQLVRWISDQAKNAHGVTLSPEAARLLSDLVGDDMGRLDNELAKLALSGKTGKITPDDITSTIAFQKELEMYELTNSLSAGNVPGAVQRWRQLMQLDPGSEYRVFTWIAIWLTGLQRAFKMKRHGMGNRDIVKEARIWKSELQETYLQTMQMLGEQGVEKAIAQLAEIEFQSKTGVGDAAENVERFLLSLKLR